jgi:single-strand DNA-binding protein
MQDMNFVVVEGNLGREPELKYTSSGMAVVKFSIASNFSKKSADGSWTSIPVWIDVTAWEKTAELVSTNLHKGMKARVFGKLRVDSWEKDGVRHSRMYVLADRVEWWVKKEGVPQREPGQDDEGPRTRTETAPDGFQDDVPFRWRNYEEEMFQVRHDERYRGFLSPFCNGRRASWKV